MAKKAKSRANTRQAKNTGKVSEAAKRLGERIRSMRLRMGMTQADLAKQLGLASPASISNYENGTTELRDNTKDNLESVLGSLSEQGSESNDASPSSYGVWLRNQRLKKDLSVPELATKAGVSAVTIYNIEGGRIQNPQQATQTKLTKALGEKPAAEVVSEIEKEASIEGLGKIIDFDPYNDNEWPTCWGVYVLYDISDRPIYVGQGQQISTRLNDHRTRFFFNRPLVEYGSYIKVTADVLRKQLEQVFIKFLKSNAVVNKQFVDR